MIPNNSPWLKQLNRTRPVVALNEDVKTDIAIVGGGIAGIATAFFTLRDTTKKVVLIEADKVAHGATGHNAGQLTSYFERPLSDLVAEFGLDLAVDGQRSVESAWGLLDEMMALTKLQTPSYRFTGYAGLSDLRQLLTHLGNNRYRVLGSLPPETILVAEEWEAQKDIPAEYRDLYTVVPQAEILKLLETTNPDYIALLAYQKGCMNSALFSEELLGYLIATYPKRFAFYEGSPMSEVRLSTHDARLKVLGNTVTADRVVLCTNGFEHFKIINDVGQEIDPTFHQMIVGRIGYMAGHLEPRNAPPTAISYFPPQQVNPDDPTGETYTYLTRRPHNEAGGTEYNLVCTSGPEKVLPNDAIYSRADACLDDVQETIDRFLRANYRLYSPDTAKYEFCWHGLMGYTPNGVRRIGPEPVNPVLMYNLGCNGIGLLPAIFGGKRISEFVNNKKMEPSIFDPHDQRETK